MCISKLNIECCCFFFIEKRLKLRCESARERGAERAEAEARGAAQKR